MYDYNKTLYFNPGYPAKFIVVTMEAGEPDLQHCVKSIESQKHVVIVHQLIRGMSEIDAHNALYTVFNDFDETYIRAKIDADMVLTSEYALYSIADQFNNEPHIQLFTAALHDYMTDQPLMGIPFYAPNVKFKKQTDRLRCDQKITIPDWPTNKDLQQPPIGTHMFHCDARTAFRYGLHRGIKRQTDVYIRTIKAYEKNQDNIRLSAIKGFQRGLSPMFQSWREKGDEVPPGFNYTDYEFNLLFDESIRQEFNYKSL